MLFVDQTGFHLLPDGLRPAPEVDILSLRRLIGLVQGLLNTPGKEIVKARTTSFGMEAPPY